VKNAVLIFVVLLALLGIGTILLVEKFSGDQILPRSIHGISLTELSRRYERGERAFKRWWNKVTDQAPELSLPSPAPAQEGNPGEKKIIKWQDEKGVWHYEYAAPSEYEVPASPP